MDPSKNIYKSTAYVRARSPDRLEYSILRYSPYAIFIRRQVTNATIRSARPRRYRINRAITHGLASSERLHPYTPIPLHPTLANQSDKQIYGKILIMDLYDLWLLSWFIFYFIWFWYCYKYLEIKIGKMFFFFIHRQAKLF